jgi:dihydrofolate reductase
MRRIVNSTFVSLDGVINHMERWHFDFIDEELDAIALAQLHAADAMLMGRTTYEIYAGAWPGRDGEYADGINAIAKHVVSTTLTNPEWANTTVLGGDLVESVRALKEAPGKDILMHGYGPVAKTLMAHGLIDELFLWVHPVLAGVGGPDDLLLADGVNVGLSLVEARPLASGIVTLAYSAVPAVPAVPS